MKIVLFVLGVLSLLLLVACSRGVAVGDFKYKQLSAYEYDVLIAEGGRCTEAGEFAVVTRNMTSIAVDSTDRGFDELTVTRGGLSATYPIGITVE